MTNFRIATAQDFDPTEVVQLPSMIGTDIAVKLQQPDPFKLLLASEDGNIPDFLTNIVVSALNETKTETVADLNDPETIRGIFAMMDVVAIASFVEPQVVADKDWDGSDDIVPVSRIKPGDRAWVMNWALGVGFNSLESFPPQQEAPNDGMDVVPKGENVPVEAE